MTSRGRCPASDWPQHVRCFCHILFVYTQEISKASLCFSIPFAMTLTVTTFYWDQMGRTFTRRGTRRTSLPKAFLKPYSFIQKILLALDKLLELTETEVTHPDWGWLQLYWSKHVMKLLDKSSHVFCVNSPLPAPGIRHMEPFRLMLSILLLDLFFKILMSSRRNFFPCHLLFFWSDVNKEYGEQSIV